jgi:hypothetical protein
MGAAITFYDVSVSCIIAFDWSKKISRYQSESLAEDLKNSSFCAKAENESKRIGALASKDAL